MSDLGGDPHESDANSTIRIKSMAPDPFAGRLIYWENRQESNSNIDVDLTLIPAKSLEVDGSISNIHILYV